MVILKIMKQKNINSLTNQREIDTEQVGLIKSITLTRKNKTDIKVGEQEWICVVYVYYAKMTDEELHAEMHRDEQKRKGSTRGKLFFLSTPQLAAISETSSPSHQHIGSWLSTILRSFHDYLGFLLISFPPTDLILLSSRVSIDSIASQNNSPINLLGNSTKKWNTMAKANPDPKRMSQEINSVFESEVPLAFNVAATGGMMA